MLEKLASSGTPPSTDPSSPASAITASAAHRVRREQQLDQLHAHALARELFESGARGDRGTQPVRVRQSPSP